MVREDGEHHSSNLPTHHSHSEPKDRRNDKKKSWNEKIEKLDFGVSGLD